mmetsp:Transcript_4878/g.17699  ORF Transcript_4878/g.17699 Transcript_4878/m.17699 type:complete len:249 (-) Transcript_4878:515-1261(-)
MWRARVSKKIVLLESFQSNLQLFFAVSGAERAEFCRRLRAANRRLAKSGGGIDTLLSLLGDLSSYPLERHLETIGELHRRRPAELFLDELVVGVATAHALRTRNVLDGQLLARELHRHGLHFVHGDHFIGANVHGLGEIALGETQDTFNAIVNVRKRARLLTIAPHFNLRRCRRRLAAKRRRGFLATTLPGTVRTVDVVESTNARLDAEIALVVLVHFLAGKLFEPVRVLRLRRPRARLLQAILHLRG